MEDIVKNEPTEEMDVDDLPPPPEDLAGIFLIFVLFQGGSMAYGH